MYFVVYLLPFFFAILSQGEALNTCRLCSSCGRNFPVEAGRRLNSGDYGAFRMYSNLCEAPYEDKSIKTEPVLCCTFENPCRLCQLCGGHYPYLQGKRLLSGDWGPWMAYGQSCKGGYTSTWKEVSLCCKAKTYCRLCVGCGPGLSEVGRVMHTGDWGKYQQYSRETCKPGDTANYGTFGGNQGFNPSLCCVSEN